MIFLVTFIDFYRTMQTWLSSAFAVCQSGKNAASAVPESIKYRIPSCIIIIQRALFKLTYKPNTAVGIFNHADLKFSVQRSLHKYYLSVSLSEI